MCSSGGGGGYSGPSEAELAQQRAAEAARISAQNTQAASAQGAGAQNVTQAAVMANRQRVRRNYGVDSTMTGAGGASGLGVGTKSSLGM